MASDGSVVVSPSALEAGSSDTEAVASQIASQLGDLKGYLAPLVASWEGEAASSYQAQQQKWNQAADDLQMVLKQIAQALREAGENHASGERANASMWQG